MIDNKHKYLPYDEDFMECHPKKDGKDKKEEKSIVINNKNNIDCPLLDKQVNSIIRRCPPTELVKNGGFEQTGVFQTFAGWDETTTNYTIRSFEKPYEGFVCAEFISRQTTVPITKTATLSQEISVTPGCFLVLSFAENFRRAAEGGFDGLNIRASVFYEEAGRVNLINIEIGYSPEADQAGKGYVFHQKASDIPVPPNISKVTVEFFVQVTDVGSGGNTTQWLLDGVSLRAI
jgi:hypothetical protein